MDSEDLDLDEFVKKYITGDSLRKLPKREFGKYMSDPAEELVKDIIEKKLKIKVFKAGEDSDGAGHFDLYTEDGYTIQVKFRSKDGVTPTSQQIYTHNWKQKLQYKVGDFHCIIFVICHKGKREPRDWFYCFVPAERIVAPNDPKLLRKDIPAVTLKQGLDWLKQLKENYAMYQQSISKKE